MSNPAHPIDRRKFLRAAGLAGAAFPGMTTLAAAEAAKPDPLITDVQDWQRYLGDGVDKRPYGSPSKFEKHVVRRDVPWLTASPESSVNFTPLHELEGIITTFISGNQFSVNGVPVAASGIAVPTGLALGARVEVQAFSGKTDL